MRSVVFVIITLVLIAAAGCRYFKIKVEDEGPIIVKNGSMTVDTDDPKAKWTEENGQDQWSNETGKEHHNDLWVLVVLNDNTKCGPLQGKPVQIDYSDASFNPQFKVVGNPPRTKVTPSSKFILETDQRLRHRKANDDNDGEYITGVKVQGQTLQCDYTKLKAIYICSSGDVADCK
jgi:hypothetical protein